MNVFSRVAAIVAGLVMLGGCTSLQRSFPGAAPDDVWTTLVVVAERPQYEAWKVAANEVWTDEAARRIEIYRELRRILNRPTGQLREKRSFRLQIRLEPTDPPTVTFLSRGFGVPGYAEEEGLRFLDDVSAILAGPPGAEFRAEHRAEPQPPDEADQEILDALGLDDSEPPPHEPEPETQPQTLPPPPVSPG